MGGRLFDWLGAGLAADRPADVDMPALLVSPGTTALYFATDTKIISFFDESGPSWFEVDVSALAGLAFMTLPDVDATGLTDGQVFKWDATASKLIPLSLNFQDAESIQDLIGAMLTDGSGMTVSYDDGTGTILFTCNIIQYTDELAQDALAAAFAAGTHSGISIVYNDVTNTFDFTVPVQYTDEMAQDTIAAIIAAGTQVGISIAYNDGAGTLSFSIIEASAAEVWTGTAQNRVVTPKAIKDAAAPAVVSYAAAVTLDLNAGLNFEIDLTGNVTFNAPTNAQPGDSGTIRIKQDATGGRVATWNAIFEFPGGQAVGGVLTTTANGVDMLSYIVSNSGKFRCVLAKDFKA